MNMRVCVHTCAWGMHAVCAYICSRGVCCMDGAGDVGMCMFVVCGVHVHMDVCMACIVHIPIGGVLCAVCGV